MKADRVYLRHVLDAIEKIDSYASVGRDVFMGTSHWQDAIIRQLEIIAEAAKRLSKGLRSPAYGSSLASNGGASGCADP